MPTLGNLAFTDFRKPPQKALLKSLLCVGEFAETAAISGSKFNRYSVRSATIGFTRVARRAGTKHDKAATAVSNAETTR